MIIERSMSQGHQGFDFHFTSDSPLCLSVGQPLIQEVESLVLLPLRDQQTGNNQRLLLLIKNHKIIGRLYSAGRPALRRR